MEEVSARLAFQVGVAEVADRWVEAASPLFEADPEVWATKVFYPVFFCSSILFDHRPPLEVSVVLGEVGGGEEEREPVESASHSFVRSQANLKKRRRNRSKKFY